MPVVWIKAIFRCCATLVGTCVKAHSGENGTCWNEYERISSLWHSRLVEFDSLKRKIMFVASQGSCNNLHWLIPWRYTVCPIAFPLCLNILAQMLVSSHVGVHFTVLFALLLKNRSSSFLDFLGVFVVVLFYWSFYNLFYVAAHPGTGANEGQAVHLLSSLINNTFRGITHTHICMHVFI